jgi:hypothetical protein
MKDKLITLIFRASLNETDYNKEKLKCHMKESNHKKKELGCKN